PRPPKEVLDRRPEELVQPDHPEAGQPGPDSREDEQGEALMPDRKPTKEDVAKGWASPNKGSEGYHWKQGYGPGGKGTGTQTASPKVSGSRVAGNAGGPKGSPTQAHV